MRKILYSSRRGSSRAAAGRRASFNLYYIENFDYANAGECRISIIDDMDIVNSPMVVTKDEKNDRPNFVYPTPDDPANLRFDEGEEISVFCPGQDFRGIRVKESGHLQHSAASVGGKKKSPRSNSIDEDVETVRCVRGNKIKFDGKIVDFKTLSCDFTEKTSHGPVMKETNERCSRGRKYVIGYEMADGRFLETIHLCHDEQVSETLWSHNVVLPTNVHGDTKFLARGHLTANADEIYKSEQEATFFYANAVPMWQSINENPGNWYLVEDYVRELAFAKRRPLDAWAGGFGILELENKPIFLTTKKQIPVPRLLYKCVVDRQAKESVCFVVANNPYLSKKEYAANADKYDRCEKLKACNAIFPNHNDLERGLMYCCALNDFYRRNRQLLGLDEIEKFLNYKAMKLPPVVRAKKALRKTTRKTQKNQPNQQNQQKHQPKPQKQQNQPNQPNQQNQQKNQPKPQKQQKINQTNKTNKKTNRSHKNNKINQTNQTNKTNKKTNRSHKNNKINQTNQTNKTNKKTERSHKNNKINQTNKTNKKTERSHKNNKINQTNQTNKENQSNETTKTKKTTKLLKKKQKILPKNQ
ncbi:unnamed protein product [Trichogramma brassicae]|uniref:DNA/RNA non-specific endonuclease/pyrophosphatase/phosphodiesterase domain-containing protein n=1 Tax=Trichogramma brassicae TaxID=86971 RepID=A0A6H5IWH7_9HYME|nr:unnamed protein product [Trichogramma brassicae]